MSAVQPRLVLVCQDTPFPVRHGGQMDMWSRLEAWSALGARLHVIYWTLDEATGAPAVNALTALGCEVTALTRTRSVRSVVQSRVPPLAYSMRPIGDRYQTLVRQLEGFAPQAILLENWPGVLTAWSLATDLSLPLIYRSQNVETAYWREIAAAAHGIARFRYSITARRIGRLERAIRMGASLVLDISSDDAHDADGAGMLGRSIVLPPLWSNWADGSPKHHLGGSQNADVVFAGSLWPPHHVEGIHWLVKKVLPHLRTALGRPLIARIVGSRPTDHVRRIAMEAGVECRTDVEDFQSEVLQARVLVNPVQRSSGINMKMLDFLTSGRPVVSTSAGVRGLTRHVRELVTVADEPKVFATAILNALLEAQGPTPLALHALVRDAYGVGPQEQFLRELNRRRLEPPDALRI